jgi:uncharacterized protein
LNGPLGVRHQHLGRRPASACIEIDTASEAASLGACRDPKDDKFLALAVACEAMTLISSDADLLSLQRWRNIAILTPAEFLTSAKQSSS